MSHDAPSSGTSSNTAAIAHKPYIPPEVVIPEFRPTAVLMGVLLGIIFGASSLYLALKVGMTVSASIPIAVLSITIFRGLGWMLRLRRATILENNIVQTTGSAGESIAFGVAVTMPALMILGYDMEVGHVMLVAVLGGLLGVLMMIPLRRALIVKEHGKLKYPEGTACAQVLIVGEQGGTNAKTVFTGFGIGFVYKFFMAALHLWKEIPEKVFYSVAPPNILSPLAPRRIEGWNGAAVSVEVTPELLGVGYIIGPRIASIMVAGGVLSSLVLIPAIKLFGSTAEVLFPGTKPIADMTPIEVWRSYVLYIGAGAVAAGGIISLIRALPTIISGARAGLGALKGVAGASVLRTERDVPMKFVLMGAAALVLAIWVVPSLHMNLLGSILIIIFGFLFVTVSSRLTGEIGSSSNPISGMTVATLLITCLVFLALGWVSPTDRVTALSVAAIVCIAASNGGTTSQDLKTGFLVGATPLWQQIGLLIGVLSSALVIGWTLLVLNQASTVYAKREFPGYVAPQSMLGAPEKLHGPDAKHDPGTYRVLQLPDGLDVGEVKIPPGKYLADEGGEVRYFVDPGINGTLDRRDDGTRVAKYEAPKARLMSLIIDGILTQKLPWGLVLLGVFISIVLELCGISALPFAVGVYLPISSSMPIFAGGLARYLVNRKVKFANEAESDSSPGVLYSSGLIAGGAIAGIGVAMLALREDWMKSFASVGHGLGAIAQSDLFATFMFVLLTGALYAVGRGWLFRTKPTL